MNGSCTKRLAVPLFVVVLTIISCGDMSATPVQPATDRDVPVTTMVDVDGVSLLVKTAGLETRKPGEAVVVFENGAGMPVETWDPILPAVARLAPVVAYDRSGTGQSPWDGEPPTPQRVTARLARLLTILRVGPPYVLVGHSWGGALMRYFAGDHPTQPRAVLYIDPTDITQSPDDEKMIFESIGAGIAAREEFYSFMDRSVVSASAAVKAEAVVMMGLFKQSVAARNLPPAPRVPATVILASRPPAMPSTGLPFDSTKYAAAFYQLRLRRLRGWVQPPGEFIVATSAGHFVHRDEPQVVIDAVRRLIESR